MSEPLSLSSGLPRGGQFDNNDNTISTNSNHTNNRCVYLSLPTYIYIYIYTYIIHICNDNH